MRRHGNRRIASARPEARPRGGPWYRPAMRGMSRWVVSVAAVVVVATGVAAVVDVTVAAPAFAADADDIERRLDEAVRAFRSGERAPALAVADAVVAEAPSSPRAWNVRGWMRLELGDLDAADADFVQALVLEPKFAGALANRGVVCARRDDGPAALEWFARAIDVNPRYPAAWVETGRAHQAAGRTQEARAAFSKAVEVGPGDNSAWQNFGWFEQRQQRWDDALACYARALAIDPKDRWTLDASARTRGETGDLDATIDALDALEAAGGEFDLRIAARAEAVARERDRLKGTPVRLRRREAETLRGLRFKADVAMRTVSRDEAGKEVSDWMASESGADARRARTKGLARLGLVPAATQDVGVARAMARRGQIAGFYDSDTKTFSIVGDGERAADPSVVVHELVHALQDQHFDLDAYRERSLGRAAPGVADEDLELATRALTEGDAMFVHTAHMMSEMGYKDRTALIRAVGLMGKVMASFELGSMVKAMRLMGALAALGDDERRAIESLDPYTLTTEVAPYLLGYGFVAAVHTRGGWDAVATVYADPPRTTEQCLHPERYLDRRDAPTLLPYAAVPAPAGWTERDVRTLGELNVSVLLGAQGADARTTRAASAGWDGDLLRTWLDASGRAAIAWGTTWDTEADAAEFLAAYRGVLAKKYEKLADLAEYVYAIEPGCANAELLTMRGWRWECGDAPDSRGYAVVRGREVFVVEGLPADAALRVLIDLALRPVAHVD